MVSDILLTTAVVGWTMVGSMAVLTLFFWLSMKIEKWNKIIGWLVYFMSIPIVIFMMLLARQIAGFYFAEVLLVVLPMLLAMVFITIAFVYLYLAEKLKEEEIKEVYQK